MEGRQRGEGVQTTELEASRRWKVRLICLCGPCGARKAGSLIDDFAPLPD